jgi:hypothetical protein
MQTNGKTKGKTTLLFLLMLIPVCIFAQTPINTDRPDQSDGVYVLPRGVMQVENGLTFARNTVLNNFMFRYGLTGSTEIRALFDVGMENNERGLLPVSLSVKQRIIHQKGIVPAISLVGYVGSGRLASRAFQTEDNFQFTFIAAFENEITDRFSIGYNLGTNSFHNDLLFTLCFAYAFTERLSGFAEYFAHFEKAIRPSHNADFGLLYLITNDLQIDLAFGFSLSRNPELFVTTGISYRF